MASPIYVNGTPLSAILAPYTSGSKAAATGIYENGVDICNKYAPYTSGTKAALTGIKKNGTDLRDIFQAAGSSPAGVISDPNYALMYSSYVMTGTLTYNVDSKLTIGSGGTWTVLNFNSGSAGTPRTGNWFSPPASGAGSPYQVMFTWTLTSGSAPTISGSTGIWMALSADRGISFELDSTASVQKNCTGNLRVQIRRTSDGVVLSDQTIQLGLQLQQA